MGLGSGLADLLDHETDGWLWPETVMLGVRVRVAPKPTERWLPAGLRMAEPAEATILVADYRESVFGSYQETGLILHTRIGAFDTLFWAWMIVNHDGALIFGRDSLGVPKKMGDVAVELEDGIRVTARRRGTTLVRVSGTLGAPDPSPPPLMGAWSTNVVGTASRFPGSLPSSRARRSRRLASPMSRSSSTGASRIPFTSSESATLSRPGATRRTSGATSCSHRFRCSP